MTQPDPYTQGAQDMRGNHMDRAFAFEGTEQESYRAGWRSAFRLACQRPDAADVMPWHFN